MDILQLALIDDEPLAIEDDDDDKVIFQSPTRVDPASNSNSNINSNILRSSNTSNSTKSPHHLSIHPMDPHSLSRDDSDVGNEYFDDAITASNSNYFHLAMSPDDDCATGAAVAAASSARTPPRVTSSNSLYGEDLIMSSYHRQGGSQHLQQQHQQPFLSPPSEFEGEDDSALHQPFLTVNNNNTANTGNSSLDNTSQNTGTNLNLSLETEDDSQVTVTTPPSVQYPASLSPPPCEAHWGHRPRALSYVESAPASRISAGATRPRSSSGGGSIGGSSPHIHGSHHHNHNGSSSNNNHNNGSSNNSNILPQHRPPRAPIQFRITVPARRSQQQQQIVTSSSMSSLNNNNNYYSTASSTGSNHQNHQHHLRGHSLGDASLLSALTDSDCEGPMMPHQLHHHHHDRGFTAAGGGSGGSTASGLIIPRHNSNSNSISFGLSRHHPVFTSGGSLNKSNSAYTLDTVDPQDEEDLEGDDQDAAIMLQGMDIIDIPMSLQQPILGDADEDENLPPPQSAPSPLLQQLPPPGVHLSTTVRMSELRAFETEAETAVLLAMEERLSTTVRMSELRAFETEAETAVLLAMEERLKERRDEMLLFENVTNAEAENILAHDEPQATELRSTRQPDEDMHADDDDVVGEDTASRWRAVRKLGNAPPPSEEDDDDETGRNAADMLVQNARKVMNATIDTRRGGRGRDETMEDDRYMSKDVSAPKTVDSGKGAPAGCDDEVRHNGKDTNNCDHTSSPRMIFLLSVDQVKDDWLALEAFLIPQKKIILATVRNVLMFPILPSLGLAFALYYGLGNPLTGGEEKDSETSPSLSWMVLFVGVRHPILWNFARGCEFVLSRFFGVVTPPFMRIVGPRVSLVIAQSKGWPCCLLVYCVLVFILLSGHHSFAKHWLYWYVH
jgi:hypothetical protein